MDDKEQRFDPNHLKEIAYGALDGKKSDEEQKTGPGTAKKARELLETPLQMPRLGADVKVLYRLNDDGTVSRGFLGSKHLAEILVDYGYSVHIPKINDIAKMAKFLVVKEINGKERVGFYAASSRVFLEIDSHADLRNTSNTFILNRSTVLRNDLVDGCTFDHCIVTASTMTRTTAQDSEFFNSTVDDCVYEKPVAIMGTRHSSERILAERPAQKEPELAQNGIPEEGKEPKDALPGKKEGFFGRLARWVSEIRLPWKDSRA